MILRSLPLLALAAAAASPALAQQTATLLPVADNTLYENATGATSNGAGAGLFVGLNSTGSRRRAVLRFDVAGALPPGAKVLAATLSLQVLQSNATTATTAEGHRLLQAWGEGTSVAGGATSGGNGTAATAGDATWLHTFFPGSTWTSPGGDFAVAPSFEIVLPTLGLSTSIVSRAAAADVQQWLDQPAMNFGWLLMTDETTNSTARRCASREATAGAPQLSITYLPPGQAAPWGTGCTVGAGTFDLAILGAPVGGTTVQLPLTGGPATQTGVYLYALELDPVGASFLTQCALHLPLGPGLVTGNLFVTSAAGSASAPFAVPLGFAGVLVTAQAAALGGSPAGFVFSNAAALCLQ